MVSKAADVDSRNGSNKQAMRAEAMKARLCKALIQVIDEHGYAEASLSRVQQAAGVSRGAMTHHFPSKHDLVCETTISMLDASFSPIARRLDGHRSSEARTFAQTLNESWERVVDTPEGRALVEILVASRTDEALFKALRKRLQLWDRKSSESIAQLFVGSGGEEDDVVVLWSICRSFLRGLFLHRQFVSDPRFLTRMFRRFTDIMEPHMTLRSGQ